MNLPNFITVCRVIAIPLFVYLLAYGHRPAAFITFVLAGLSDALDGFLARILNQRSTLGTFLDPMADKLLAATAFVTMAIFRLVPFWLVIIVISRDIILTLGSLIHYLVVGRLEIVPRPLGKATTFVQFTTVSAALAGPLFAFPALILETMFLTTALLTVASGIQYIFAGLKSANA